MFRSFTELSLAVNNSLNKNKISFALSLIKNFVENILANPLLFGVVTNIDGIDELCLAIGKKALPISSLTKKQNAKENYILYIATQFFLTGGHTAVVIDFIKAEPNKKHIILLTDIFDDVNKDSIKNRFINLPVELKFAPQKISLHQKLIWVCNNWIDLNPEKVFLFNHPEDSVATAAALPQMPGELFFYHHTDYTIGLGSQLKHAKHIDMNPALYFNCRDHYKITNYYCPLVCEDYFNSAKKNDRFKSNEKINTASAGHFAKFNQPYIYSYIELLPEIMKITNGNHLHIGFLPSKMLRAIKKNLSKSQISAEKFIYLPIVKSVLNTILDHKIDLYVTSFPIGGGRTAIEVMASGTPILCHLNYRSIFLSENHYLYPEAFLWKTPVELKSILQSLNSKLLIEHSKLSRNHYLKNFTPEKLKTSIQNDFTNTNPSYYIKTDKLIPNITQLLLDFNFYQLKLIKIKLRLKFKFLKKIMKFFKII